MSSQSNELTALPSVGSTAYTSPLNMLAVMARPCGSPGMSFTSMVPPASPGIWTVRASVRDARFQKRSAPRSSTGPLQTLSVVKKRNAPDLECVIDCRGNRPLRL
jgi:hypothetical protein